MLKPKNQETSDQNTNRRGSRKSTKSIDLIRYLIDTEPEQAKCKEKNGEIKGNTTTPVEGFYKWKSREEELVLKRRTNSLFLPENILNNNNLIAVHAAMEAIKEKN